MRLKPFKALRPPAALAQEVACPPYDVVSTDEARAIAQSSPKSFMHIIRSEVDCPEETPPYDDRVYQKAAENLQLGRDREWLVLDEQSACYVYRQRMGDQEQVGLVACCHVQDYGNNVIKKHEKTMPQKEQDRTRHMLSAGAHTGPVFLAYREEQNTLKLFEQETQQEPVYELMANGGVQHTVWRTSSNNAWVEAFQDIPCAYVADGHHRSASAFRAARERSAGNPDHAGDEEYNWFLAVLFPAGQLNILPYNRVVKDLNGLSPEAFLDAAGKRFNLTPGGEPEPGAPGSISMFLGDTWYKLSVGRTTDSDPVQALDIQVLQDQLLHPVLGIDDPRTNDRIGFVGGIHGPRKLEETVKAGDAEVAFSMFPTSMDQLMAVADAGLYMPPKSTWFEPKLLSGLLVHLMD